MVSSSQCRHKGSLDGEAPWPNFLEYVTLKSPFRQTSVKNTSEYTLLAGATKVYVDGSFIAKATIPLVSPQETFICPLG